MTPEERQQMMDFILTSHSQSAVRMDKLETRFARFEEGMEANASRFEARMAASSSHFEAKMDRFDSQMKAMQEDQRALRESLILQREGLKVVGKACEDLVRVSRGHLARTKRLEERTDSIEEMLRVVREWIEGNLLRPPNGGDKGNA